jgi:hypothetical protein
LGIEAAYVANLGDHSISFIDAVELVGLGSVPQTPDPLLQPVELAARTDGRMLFSADLTSRRISAININRDDAEFHTVVATIETGGDAKRIVVLPLP